ncbi:histidine--tRNA ligase [Malacoplasma muris]|uniref:histidine--tRNA ligase n=1 Tax=Malacoplasma muris TaxID=2119 RepID=UPI00398EB114
MNITKPRGTNDIFGLDLDNFNHVVNILKIIAKFYNYSEIITPMFEHKELFIRNIGETSDIVTKEFYDFKDKGNREIVLRPEGTVSVIRSVIENKMLSKMPLPLKLYYIGPMFRYERPQNGRSRQFHQFGIENIGIKNVYNQIEILLMSKMVLDLLKIKNYKLKINYIGTFDTRKKWMDDLKNYFTKHIDELSDDSKNRVIKNPLRIFDDKVDSKKNVVKNAPKIDKYLTDEEKNEIDFIKHSLDVLHIEYEFDSTMVRGLDYYFGLVFEYISTSKELSENTIIGGGRYSKLVGELGGQDTDCMGFALGIERLVAAYVAENQNVSSKQLDIYIASFGNTKLNTLNLSDALRKSGFSVDSNLSLDKLDKHFKYASKLNPKKILIFGDKEKDAGIILIKDQDTKKEISIKITELINYLKDNL